MPTLDELLNTFVQKNCSSCQGMSIPGRKEGENGFCPSCDGKAYITISKYAAMTDQDRVDVLETELMRLRPDLAQKYGKRK
jgi:hypothetical protein